MREESQKEQFSKEWWVAHTPVFLAQSDTTAGFLCADFTKLNAIKGRAKLQNVLLTLDSLEKLKNLVRPPAKYKNKIRKSTKNTFIYRGKHALMLEKPCNANLAIRVVRKGNVGKESQEASHNDFLQFFPYLFSSSANAHKCKFDLDFACGNADIIVLDKRGLQESNPSKIYKVSNVNLKCVR